LRGVSIFYAEFLAGLKIQGAFQRGIAHRLSIDDRLARFPSRIAAENR
jgi:hypothetical protein